MSIVQGAAKTGGAMPPATVEVWGTFVRVFHWSLVALFAIELATGDDSERVHIVAGYAITGLLALRLLWGFAGPRHARFSYFVRPPREVIAYLRNAAALRARRYLGHNPAGGAMIVALLLAITGVCVTGYMLTSDAYRAAEWVEELHGALAYGTVGLIILHVVGVLVASFEHRENLIKAMFTGRKRAPDSV